MMIYNNWYTSTEKKIHPLISYLLKFNCTAMKILNVKHILFVCMAMWGNHLWDSLALLTCHHCCRFRYHLRNRDTADHLLVHIDNTTNTQMPWPLHNEFLRYTKIVQSGVSLLIPVTLKLWLCISWQSSPACVNMLVSFRDNMLCPTGMSKYQQESSFSNFTLGFK